MSNRILSVVLSQYLYLSDQTILSLPSFEVFPCQMDLPEAMAYGTSGLVTDNEGIERLMVCSDTGCFQRTDSGWEQENAMLDNRYASLLLFVMFCINVFSLPYIDILINITLLMNPI